MFIRQSGQLHYRLRFLIASAATLAIIVASGVLAYLNARAQDESTAVVMRTHRTLAALIQIETTMTDAETGQRGYLLTGEERFLEPWLAATGKAQVPMIQRPPIGALLGSLRQVVPAGGVEHALLGRIDTLVRQKLDELEQTISLRRAGKEREALALVHEGRGKRIMDALRVTLSDMRTEQRRQIEASEARHLLAAHRAYLSAILSCVVSVLSIAMLLAAARRAERGLLREEERFHMLADHISQHAWTLDAGGHFEWFNRRWAEYTGLEGDLEGQWRAASDHPVHHDRVARGLQHALATGEAWEDIFPLHARDGGWHWFLVRAQPIRGEDGKVRRWFGTNTNIDERLRLEQELKDSNRRKDEFIATLAHELRNPLAPIQAGLELMRVNAAFPLQLEPTRAIMGRQMKHLVRLIDDLLDISRISSGKLELRRQPVTVRAIVDSALETSRLHIASSGHTLDVSLPPEPLQVDGDPVRLAQVLSNLLNNGAKYTPEGGLIGVTAKRDGDDVLIQVSDNGIGIDPVMLPDIFDLFSQAPEARARRQGGIGIGLSIARQLVEMHGGSLSADSAGLGHGATFTVRLPLTLPASAPEPAPAHLPTQSNTSGGRRILILDDNVDAAQTLGALLGLAGHTVQLAHTGNEAIALAPGFRPQLAFLDIGLPDMSGHEVARALRAEPGLAGTTLVALTGWGAAADRAVSREAGFDHHLTKPVSLEALAAALPGLALPSSRSPA